MGLWNFEPYPDSETVRVLLLRPWLRQGFGRYKKNDPGVINSLTARKWAEASLKVDSPRLPKIFSDVLQPSRALDKRGAWRDQPMLQDWCQLRPGVLRRLYSVVANGSGTCLAFRSALCVAKDHVECPVTSVLRWHF